MGTIVALELYEMRIWKTYLKYVTYTVRSLPPQNHSQTIVQRCTEHRIKSLNPWNQKHSKASRKPSLSRTTGGYHLRHALYKVSESSLNRVDFWHALMDPSHGSAQDLPRTRGGVDGVLKYLQHREVAKHTFRFSHHSCFSCF